MSGLVRPHIRSRLTARLTALDCLFLPSSADQSLACLPQERSEREGQLQTTGDHLKSLLYLAAGTISTLHTSTARVQRPFLLPEMVERIAGMLNYFLLYLTGRAPPQSPPPGTPCHLPPILPTPVLR